MNGLVKASAVSLLVGAILLVLINAILTPQLPTDASEEVLRLSNIYLVRLSAALVDMLLLLFGSIALYAVQAKRGGALAAVAFGVLFLGAALTVGLEWSNVFVFPSLAQAAPEALDPLDDAILLTIGFGTGMGLLLLGWLLNAISLLRTGALGRRPPLLLLAGIVAMPVLQAALGMTGGIVAAVLMGVGLVDVARGVVLQTR